MASITDGTSNTLLAGERRINLNDINTGNDCYDNEPAVRPASDCDVLRRAQASAGSWLTPAQDLDAPDPQTCGSFGGPGLCQYGSSHRGMMFGLLCDCSVRPITYAVNATNFKNLASATTTDRGSHQPGLISASWDAIPIVPLRSSLTRGGRAFSCNPSLSTSQWNRRPTSREWDRARSFHELVGCLHGY